MKARGRGGVELPRLSLIRTLLPLFFLPSTTSDMKRILPYLRPVLLVSLCWFAIVPSQVFATILNLNYTFTTAVTGTAVNVTWTTDNPSDVVNVTLIRISAFTAVQTKTGLPNSGSTTFLIGNSHPPGNYQFYIENSSLTFWHYGPEFNLLPPEICCQSESDFIVKAAQGFTVVHQKCGISVVPKALGNCQQTTYTWGDGSTTGPLPGNATTGHIYSALGYYTICAKIEEINADHSVCFTRDSCWSICAVCDTCTNPIVKNEWAKIPHEWQDYSGGSYAHFDMYADAQGDFYVTGNRTNGIDQDGFVAKCQGIGGATVWEFSFGGLHADKGSVISQNPLDGGFYLGGQFRSSSFDLPSFGGSSPKTLTLHGTWPRDDVFLARYDASRNLVWAFELGSDWVDQVDGMAVDASGNVYVAGATRALVDFNPLGPARIQTLPVNCPFVAKYHPDGQLQWVRYLYDPAAGDNCGINLGLALDANADVYISGEFYGTPHWEGWPTPNPLPPLAITTNNTHVSAGAPYVAKFKSNGDFVWAFDIQDAAKNMAGAVRDVEVKDHYLYITGNVLDNVTVNFVPLGGDPALQNKLLAPNGNFIARYDLTDPTVPAGQIALGLLPLQSADDLEISENGNIYAAGYFDGTNNPRMLVNIFDADLNLLKSLQTGSGGSPEDIAYAVAPDLFGNFGVAGRFRSQQFDADPQAANGFESPTFTDNKFHVFIGKYTCDCPGDPISFCNACDSISTTLIHKPSEQRCCAAIRIHNQLPDHFSAVQISVLSGGSLSVDDVTPRPGWQLSSFIDGSSVTFHPSGGIFIPAGDMNLAFVCMSDLTAADQYLEVKYFTPGGGIVCRDTLHFTCNYCMDVQSESIVCEASGLRKMTFCIEVDPDLGWNANSVVLMSPPGVTLAPTSFPLPNLPLGSTCYSLVTYISIAAGASSDSFCIGYTLHEQDVTTGSPPLRCCMVKECFELPDCLCDPDITYATQQEGSLGGGTCCWDITLHQMAGMISSVQTNILTPGVTFVATAPGSVWDLMIRSPQSLAWEPSAGGALSATMVLPTICLDVLLGSAMPQLLEILWFAADGSICRDLLEFNCPPQDPCITVDEVIADCIGGGTVNLTITVTNTSSPPVFGSEVVLAPIGPAPFTLAPSNFTVSLPPGASTTLSAAATGVASGELWFLVHLHPMAGDPLHLNCCVADTLKVNVDDTPPTISCVPGLTVSLHPPAPFDALVWATDWMTSVPQDDCFPASQIQYGVRRKGSGTGFPVGQPNLTFTCADISIHQVEVWAMDAVGNASFCYSQINVQDNNGLCPAPPGGAFELHQNQPNPWSERTFIGFHLPEASEAVLRVFDAMGRTLYTDSGFFDRGENRFDLKNWKPGINGLFFYSVETPVNHATKRMVYKRST